jgi:hypothetical protein
MDDAELIAELRKLSPEHRATIFQRAVEGGKHKPNPKTSVGKSIRTQEPPTLQTR